MSYCAYRGKDWEGGDGKPTNGDRPTAIESFYYSKTRVLPRLECDGAMILLVQDEGKAANRYVAVTIRPAIMSALNALAHGIGASFNATINKCGRCGEIGESSIAIVNRCGRCRCE